MKPRRLPLICPCTHRPAALDASNAARARLCRAAVQRGCVQNRRRIKPTLSYLPGDPAGCSPAIISGSRSEIARPTRRRTHPRPPARAGARGTAGGEPWLPASVSSQARLAFVAPRAGAAASSAPGLMRIWAAVGVPAPASSSCAATTTHQHLPRASTATYHHSWSWRRVVDQHQLGLMRTQNHHACSSQEHRVNLHIVKMHASIPLPSPSGMFSLRTITGEPPYLPAGVRSEGAQTMLIS